MVSETEEVTGCLKALADPTRLAIISTLVSDELSVHQVADQFPMSRPAISKHLKILREAGLVAERAEGRERIYSLETEPLRAVQHWLDRFEHLGNGRQKAKSNRDRYQERATSGPREGASRRDWRVW
ncbi:MAG: metalloregulator ArsR/SmtB family transcription factor [Acidobacteriota bacterium]